MSSPFRFLILPNKMKNAQVQCFFIVIPSLHSAHVVIIQWFPLHINLNSLFRCSGDFAQVVLGVATQNAWKRLAVAWVRKVTFCASAAVTEGTVTSWGEESSDCNRLFHRFGSHTVYLMERSVKGSQAAEAAGKAYVRGGHFRVRQKAHCMFGSEPLEVIVERTAEFIFKNMGNVIFTVTQRWGQLCQVEIFRKMQIQVVGNHPADIIGNLLLFCQRQPG